MYEFIYSLSLLLKFLVVLQEATQKVPTDENCRALDNLTQLFPYAEKPSLKKKVPVKKSELFVDIIRSLPKDDFSSSDEESPNPVITRPKTTNQERRPAPRTRSKNANGKLVSKRKLSKFTIEHSLPMTADPLDLSLIDSTAMKQLITCEKYFICYSHVSEKEFVIRIYLLCLFLINFFCI